LPPPEGKGIQIHFGPKNYTDTAELAKYVIKPGEEFNAYGIANIDALDDHFFNYTQIRMRPGSHHLINQLVQGDNLQEGFTTAGCPGNPVGSFPGTQNLIRNMPPGGVQAPENVGLGSKLPANTKLCLNYHSYNFDTDVPQLREVWINVWFVDEAEVTQRASTVTVTAGPFQGIPPHTQQVLTTTATVGAEGRIVNLFGHRHAATDRFAVWKNEDLVYDSWNWQESIAFDYDSVTKNPPIDGKGRKTARRRESSPSARATRSRSSATSTIRPTTRSPSATSCSPVRCASCSVRRSAHDHRRLSAHRRKLTDRQNGARGRLGRGEPLCAQPEFTFEQRGAGHRRALFAFVAQCQLRCVERLVSAAGSVQQPVMHERPTVQADRHSSPHGAALGGHSGATQAGPCCPQLPGRARFPKQSSQVSQGFTQVSALLELVDRVVDGRRVDLDVPR